MYITEKYWGGLIGGSDDSLTLVEHLAGKQKEEVPFGEIFSDFGLDRLHGEFREPEIPLAYEDPEGWEVSIYSAIGLIADLAALLLECKENGSVDLNMLFFGEDEEGSLDTRVPVVTITAGGAQAGKPGPDGFCQRAACLWPGRTGNRGRYTGAGCPLRGIKERAV